MRFSNPALLSAIDAGAGSARPVEKAIAHNFRWDERLGDARVAAYEQPAYLPTSAMFNELANGYARYFKLRMEWDGRSDTVADTFLPVNDGAALVAPPEERRKLVRIVKIERTLRDAGLTYDQFLNAVQLVKSSSGSSASAVRHAQDTVDTFVRKWNDFDQRPPCFVGFAEDVRDEVADPDWPHLLRDRFGVGHLHVALGAAPIPIMLLEYTVKAVLRAARKIALPDDQVFRVPTVLESNLYHFFYPSPTPLPYGRTVYLAGGRDPKKLTCELVHLPVNLQSKNICNVGRITRPIPIAESDLDRVRNDHLEIVRYDSGRSDFGEMM